VDEDEGLRGVNEDSTTGGRRKIGTGLPARKVGGAVEGSVDGENVRGGHGGAIFG